MLRTAARELLRYTPTLRRRLLYYSAHRRLPNLRRPALFTEKIQWRMLHDRRELISWTCDKLRMKDHAAAHGVATPQTLWSGVDVTELANVELSSRWVLKPNHRSQLVHFGDGPADVAELERITAGWTDEGPARTLGEWAYGQASPVLLVEERIGGESPPDDLKFFVFGGEVAMIQHDVARFDGHRRRLYTPSWDPIEVRMAYPPAPPVDPPAELDELLKTATKVGAEFDFIRVDLYLVEGTIYLGEVTPYPEGGLEVYPPEFDRQLGAEWDLPGL